MTATGPEAAKAKARADSTRWPYTAADIRFMSTMIHHHAQAIVMAKMAPTHGASESVQRLCQRIINAQTDEIAMMTRWLQDRNQPVPEPNPAGETMQMGGTSHTMTSRTSARSRAGNAAYERSRKSMFFRKSIPPT